MLLFLAESVPETAGLDVPVLAPPSGGGEGEGVAELVAMSAEDPPARADSLPQTD